jgi:drug/metabolite transporter (DMT)-like permease
MLSLVWKELREKREVIGQSLGLLWLQGALLVISSTLLFYSVNYTSAMNATLVNAAQPVATGLIAWLILGEGFTRKQLRGVLLAVCGVILMIIRADLDALMALDFNRGDFLLIFAILGYGLYSVNIRRHPASLSVMATLTLVLFFGCICLLPFYVAESILVGLVPFNWNTLIAVSALALLVSILAMVMWNKSTAMIGPAKTSVFIALMPVYGAVMAVIFLDEQLYFYNAVGAALVCVGILLAVKQN